MLLTNFSLVGTLPTITLASGAVEWDLHAFAEFDGLILEPDADSVTLRWRVPSDVENPWGSRANEAAGCELVFNHVQSLHITSAGDLRPEDHTCLADVTWADTEDPALVFAFESGRIIEVAAGSAELRPIPCSPA